jgi:hypothetical protein
MTAGATADLRSLNVLGTHRQPLLPIPVVG